MKKANNESRFRWEDIKDYCEKLTESEDALTREMVSRVSDKWSLWTLSVVAAPRKSLSPLRRRTALEIYGHCISSA